jgi:hypothetical protein
MSDAPQLPPRPHEGQPQVNVAGPIQNFIYGSHVVGDQTSTAVQSSFYGKHMAAHGTVYWILHIVVAVLAAAVWGYLSWKLQWFR